MEDKTVKLQSAERVEITTLVDNFTDVLLPGSETVIRPHFVKDGEILKNALLAEHGLSLLIKVTTQEKTHSIILDTGYTNVAVPHNLEYLGLTLDNIEAVVLSHGHMDHVGALKEILELTAVSGTKTDLIIHPDAFLPRCIKGSDDMMVSFPPFPAREDLEQWGANIVENKRPLLLCQDYILVTGEIERTTPFEQGMPGALIKSSDTLLPDTFKDDQSLIIDVADKGLVIISGCAHAGIINSTAYASKLTGHSNIYAVIGGFHLSGPDMEPSIKPTIQAMKKMSPSIISPMHCTGFKAISQFAQELPDTFVHNSAGTTIVL